jgi:[ribosomal protein S5]-alanine N-acetyltransferase
VARPGRKVPGIVRGAGRRLPSSAPGRTPGGDNDGVPPLTDPVVAPGSLARSSQPVLESGDLILRPWRAEDAPTVAKAFDDPGIRQWHVRSMTEDEARTWIDSWPHRWAEESGSSWAVTDGSGVVGQIGLRRLNLPDGIGAVSYWVLPESRGHRVATRALRTLSTWTFDHLRLHRIELAHSTRNPTSCQVAKNAGYTEEGTKRSEGLHTDGWHDMHLHARLNNDPPPQA